MRQKQSDEQLCIKKISSKSDERLQSYGLLSIDQSEDNSIIKYAHILFSPVVRKVHITQCVKKISSKSNEWLQSYGHLSLDQSEDSSLIKYAQIFHAPIPSEVPFI